MVVDVPDGNAVVNGRGVRHDVELDGGNTSPTGMIVWKYNCFFRLQRALISWHNSIQ